MDDIEEQLPERVDNTYFVQMTREQKELYDEHEAVVARLYHLAKRRPLRPEEMKRLQHALACMRMCCDEAGLKPLTDFRLKSVLRHDAFMARASQ